MAMIFTAGEISRMARITSMPSFPSMNLKTAVGAVQFGQKRGRLRVWEE
jgi:hypothetical protein